MLLSWSVAEKLLLILITEGKLLENVNSLWSAADMSLHSTHDNTFKLYIIASVSIAPFSVNQDGYGRVLKLIFISSW
jgi:hypothetical protein